MDKDRTKEDTMGEDTMKEKIIRLRDVLKLHRNNTNHQYIFMIRKKVMVEYGLTPEMILDTPIDIIKNTQIKPKGNK